MMRGIVFLLCLLLAPPALAQGKPMQLELSSSHVDITTGFNGTRIVMFGTSEQQSPNLIITLRGPERTVVVRRKDRAFGTWMNRQNIEFRRVPTYYDYASTLNDSALNAYPQLLEATEAGVNALGFYPEDAGLEPVTANIFRDSLIRTMQRKGFYPIAAGGIVFLNPRFFKVAFDLPPGVPTGLYTIEASLFEGDRILARESKSLQVGQVGFNANVYLFAEGHSFFYGVFAVIMALVSGWAAFTFLRRD